LSAFSAGDAIEEGQVSVSPDLRIKCGSDFDPVDSWLYFLGKIKDPAALQVTFSRITAVGNGQSLSAEMIESRQLIGRTVAWAVT
jgi:hypothetical protein